MINLKIQAQHTAFFFQHMFLIVFFSICYYVAHHYIISSQTHHVDSIVTGGLIHAYNDASVPGVNNITGKKPVTFFDCFHFSLVTQTTVGYGALVPTHNLTKIINILQLLTIYGVIIISLF